MPATNKAFFPMRRASGVLHMRASLSLMSAALLLMTACAHAQKPVPATGDFQYKADKISITTKGVRLDGNAQITSSQLEVRAAAIAFDFEKNQITEVRAIGKTSLKVSLTPTGGGVVTHIETTSDSATLKPVTRELTLVGNVDGFYQLAKGPKTTIAGTKAVLKYIGQDLGGIITGPITLTVPSEMINANPNPNAGANAAAIGEVKITSDGAVIDGKTGVVRFTGNAHAVSKDGPNKFDVSAPEFVLTRSATNTIDTLKTSGGRAKVSIDLPVEPVKPGEVKVADPAAPAAGKPLVGKPTRVEVEADTAVVTRATNTLTFEGNVEGFYELAAAGAEPSRYDFTGSKAVLRSVPAAEATAESPAGFKADITGIPGKPVKVKTPAFSLDMSN